MMENNNIYGNRYFEAPAEQEVGEPPVVVVDDGTKAKLARLEHLEKENKDLISARDKAKEAKRKEEEDKLKQKGEYKELLDASEKEKEALKVKADAFEQLRTSEIEEAKKLLGEKWDDEYGNLSLTSLRKTVQLLSKKEKVPGTDNGEHPSDPPKTQLSDAQKREAIEKFPYMEKDKAEAAWEHVLRKTGKIK